MNKPTPEITINTLLVQLPEKKDVLIYAVNFNTSLAMIGFAEVTQLEYEFWWIQSLYVDPEHRGMGIGTQLLRRIISDAEKRGRGGVCLTASRDNNHALQWYERRGMMRVYEYADGPIMFHYQLTKATNAT